MSPDRAIYCILLIPPAVYLAAWAGVYAWKFGKTLFLLLQEAEQERQNAREWRNLRKLPR